MMQPVSQAYNAYPNTRHIDVNVTFGVIAPEASKTAVPSSSASASISQLGQTHNLIDKPTAKYASLEQDLWMLDGTFDIVPDDTSNVQIGWWSGVLSDKDGVFSSAPYVRYDFAEVQKSYGFMLTFDSALPGNYPAELEATAYGSDGAVIQTKTFYPDSTHYVVNMPTQNYKAIKFTFKKTSKPFRRVRLMEVVFGIIYKYDKNSITTLEVVHEIDPMALSLPSAEMSVTINNKNKLYNMANPSGMFAYLQDGQSLESGIAIGGVSVNMGKTYFTSAKSRDGALTAQVVSNDRMILLDSKEYNDGATGTWTLSQAVSAILAVAGLEIEVVMPSELNVTIRKCIPKKTKCREALRLACQAARCTCYISRDDKLMFVRAALITPVDELTRDRMHDDAQIEISNTTNAVKLTVEDEYAETEQIYTARNVAEGDYERTEEIDNPLVQDGQAVADWLLAGFERRTKYTVQSRGNPAVDTLNTVRVHDYYGVNSPVLVTKQTFDFKGGLEADVIGVK